MKRTIGVLTVLAAVACGGESPSGTGNGIKRGVPGSGPTGEGAGVWALGIPCTAETASICPFSALGGTCFRTQPAAVAFCGMPCDDHGTPICPTGSRCGTAVGVPLCVKDCLMAGDCVPSTSCYNRQCVPY